MRARAVCLVAVGVRRGVQVTVDGSSLAGGQEYEALLVVDTEEDKFTYKLVAEVS